MGSELLFVAVLLLGTLEGARGECPSDFVHLGNACFYFSTEEMEMQEARDYCLTVGADLATFRSCEDFRHVSNYLELYGVEGLPFWVGASRSEEGVWLWLDDNSEFRYGVPLWDPFKVIQGDDDRCAIMPHNGGYLNPEVCTTQGVSMCKADVATSKIHTNLSSSQSAIECPEPFVVVGDRCVFVNHDFHTWDDARSACADLAPNHPADLAVLNGCDMFSNIVHFLEDNHGERDDWFWIGAKDFDDSGNHRWLSGAYIEPGVPFWCPGQPNNFEDKQRCVMLWGSHYYYGADEDCSVVHKSVCEIGF